MGDFHRIHAVADVSLGQVLAERLATGFGTGWERLGLKGDAWAYVRDGEAVGLGGIEPVWSGRHVLWSYEAGLTLGDWKRALRFTRLRLARAYSSGSVRRIEATARLTHERYARFLERLGFEREGVMRAWSPEGEDMIMFSRVAS